MYNNIRKKREKKKCVWSERCLADSKNEKKIPPSPADPGTAAAVPSPFSNAASVFHLCIYFLGESCRLACDVRAPSICREKYLLIIALNQNMLEMPGRDGMTEIKGFQMWQQESISLLLKTLETHRDPLFEPFPNSSSSCSLNVLYSSTPYAMSYSQNFLARVKK